MKRLSNISPFILLLIPVFIMMVLTFGTRADNPTQTEEVVLKTEKQLMVVKQGQ
jgi:hypothetical protein